jgi:hypothetical protein
MKRKRWKAKGVYIQDADGLDVAMICNTHRPERRADRRLIKHAPRLLEAAELVLRYGLKGRDPKGKWPIDFLGLAVAAAKGRRKGRAT